MTKDQRESIIQTSG